MSQFDDQYIKLCRNILEHGENIANYNKKDSRKKSVKTAIPNHTAQAKSSARTIRLPHQVLQFNLAEEFPILVTKKVGWKTAILEILWIYQAASNDVRWLKERNIKIWNEWEIPETGIYQDRNINHIFAKNHPEEPTIDFAHTIGTAYGWIVKRYNLIENLIETLKTNPGNRRMVLSLW